MSGHSKWAQIKRQKAVTDAKRGRAFSKLSREIMVASRLGGSELDSNFRLRLVVQRAKAANMPSENIERAIKRGAGEDADAPVMLELAYEGYAQGGVALLIHALTDNRNRTVALIRNVLDNAGGHLADAGSVAWLFEGRGEIVVRPDGLNPDEVFMAAAEAGATDVDIESEFIYIWTKPDMLDRVRQAIAQRGLEVEAAELGRVATAPVELRKIEALKVLRLVESLEDLDDVRKVDTNLSISVELVESYAAA